MQALAILLMLAAAAAAAGPDQIHLAWVEEPSTTLTVLWRTLEAPAPSVVEYRPAGSQKWLTAQGGPRASGTSGQLHEATLRSLKPATRYEYRVSGPSGAWSEVHTTRTAPRPGPATYDVVFVADTGMIGRADGLTTGTKQVIEEIAKLEPLFILLGGDYAYYNTDKRFGTLDNTIDAWFEQMKAVAARAPMMPTYGNHEMFLGEGYEPWAARFPTPEGFDRRQNYSFRVGNVHYISIMAAQSSKGETPPAVRDWIEQDAAAARRAGMTWILPFLHVAPFSDGSNHPSNTTLRAQLGPVIERIGAKIALTCHDQSYERTYPLTGVPDNIQATSTSKSCYTLRDGVSWVKVSPGGKMSNINGRFAQWLTNPPPAWTAFRDNTMHHYARLRVSPGGILVEVFGVSGDGKPPVVQDTFRYSVKGCQERKGGL